ncbi:MAG TPA: FtsX-like permease family protein [Anaerolineaceae bacterium]|nr:FtsX-like permease family protein [Anaerolineaceae bacterium]
MSAQPTVRIRPRWHKVLSDLWGNKVRTLLVVASIMVGLFAMGMIATIHDILFRDTRTSYAAVNPANIQVNAGNFDDDMVDTVRSVEGVKEAEGVRLFYLMVRTGSDQWSRIAIQAIPNFDQMTINRVLLDRGSWPPRDHQIVVERNKQGDLYQAQPGMMEVRLSSGKIRRLALTGVVHDLTVGITSVSGGYFTAPIQGYINTDTLEWLEQPDSYNLLYETVKDQADDESHIRAVANRVTKIMEDNGGLVFNSIVRGSHDHPNAAYLDAMTGVLYILGFLVVFLSAFLITNTLSALLGQQAQQIAIMKTIGARSRQVSGLYMALITAYAALALALALPLSQDAGFRFTQFLAERLNVQIVSFRTSAWVALQLVGIAIVVPQAAGLVPILNGTRLRVQDALTGQVTESDPSRGNWFDRLIHRPGKTPRPLLISLRNTFRHKGRLLLTLITLILGGAVFIATFNVRLSLDDYIRKLSRYFAADVNLTMEQPYRISEIQQALQGVPGVGQVEGWSFARCELLLDNDQAGDAVQLLGPPVSSRLIQPILLKGRWIQSGDRKAIVLSERFLSRFPNLRVGDPIRLRVNGEKTTWTVVGFFQLAGKSAGFVAYTSYEYLSELVHQPNLASIYRVTSSTANLTLDQQREFGSRIETYLQNQDFNVSETQAGQYIINSSASGLNTLTIFLLVMAILTALVGSIGLMGTMSMNVLDRTREIGVLRAIGASDRAVMRLVIAEGLLIGLISWMLGTVASLPISQLLSDTIHLAVFDARSDFTFTPIGPLAWLGLVIVLSLLASILPARSAARLTIREALAYE